MDIPEKLQRKAGKNYKGWFCYTFGITSAFALKHGDTGDFTHEQMAVAHGEELSVCNRFLQCVNFWRENFCALLVAVATGNTHMKTSQEQK